MHALYNIESIVLLFAHSLCETGKSIWNWNCLFYRYMRDAISHSTKKNLSPLIHIGWTWEAEKSNCYWIGIAFKQGWLYKLFCSDIMTTMNLLKVSVFNGWESRCIFVSGCKRRWKKLFGKGGQQKNKWLNIICTMGLIDMDILLL